MGSRHKPRAGATALLVERFTQRVQGRFPGAPPGEARRIARHACGRGTERVGALAGSDGYLEHAVDLAVIAHLRHRFTRYERLLDGGVDRDEARERVRPEVLALMGRWGAPEHG